LIQIQFNIQQHEPAAANFSLRHILLQYSLARGADPALQSTWQECHLLQKGSVMLAQRLLNLLLELINALFFTIVGDLSEHPPFWTLSLMQLCSNVSTGALDRESSND